MMALVGGQPDNSLETVGRMMGTWWLVTGGRMHSGVAGYNNSNDNKANNTALITVNTVLYILQSGTVETVEHGAPNTIAQPNRPPLDQLQRDPGVS